jgi:hypothetical protein
MAQKQYTQYLDDQDGSPATTKVFFAMAGTGYETDLNDENTAEFTKAMERWIKPARKSATGLRRPVRLVSEDVPETAVPSAPAPPLPRRRRTTRARAAGSAANSQLQAAS